MRKIKKDKFLKSLKNRENKNFFNFGEDGFTYTQGIYLCDKNEKIYGYVKIPFSEQKELQEKGLLKIRNFSSSKIFKKEI